MIVMHTQPIKIYNSRIFCKYWWEHHVFLALHQVYHLWLLQQQFLFWLHVKFSSCQHDTLAYWITNKKYPGSNPGLCPFSVELHVLLSLLFPPTTWKHTGQVYWKLNFSWVWMQISLPVLYAWALWWLPTYPECFSDFMLHPTVTNHRSK